MINIRSEREIGILREANQIVACVLEELTENAQPGVTTRELDEFAERRCREFGAEPAFKGYRGYPSTICASIDEAIVHGIPGDRKLEEGQLLSIDLGVKYRGFFGDAAVTLAMGEVDEQKKTLMDVTRSALYRGIEVSRPGNSVGDISAVIQAEVEGNGFTIVREFVGHGIGTSLHEDPQIPNFREEGAAVTARLKPGMVLAIEPMVSAGNGGMRILKDKWTAVTADRSPAAHFEHTVALRDGEAGILSRRTG
jgi:methionyl aminopeptidase